jgi:hypothetical protein
MKQYVSELKGLKFKMYLQNIKQFILLEDFDICS